MAEKHIKKYPNGATLIYYQQNVSSSTNATIGFACGAEKDGKKHGLAHALEHCLFHGITDMTGDEVDEYMHFNAIQHNAHTSQNAIAVDFDCPNTYLPEVLKINSEMLAKRDFDKDLWEKEREVILQERNVRLDSERGYKVGIFDYLYNKSTYGSEDLLGDKKTLYSITTNDLKNYRDKYFISENLIVSIVSSLPYNVVKSYVEKYFINRFPSVPENKVVPNKRTYQFDDMLVPIDNVDAKSFNIKFIFESKENDTKNELFSVFENWYFNGLAGRLNKELRHNYPLTYSSFVYDYDPKDAKFKVIDVTTSPEYANDAIFITAQMLKDLVDNGISEKDFYMFQKYMLANRERKTNIKMRDSYNMFYSILYNRKPFVKNFYNKVMSLKRKDINNYISNIYGNSKLMLGYKGDLIAASYHSLLNEPVTVLSLEHVRKLMDPLYSLEEIVEMYRPKDRLNPLKEELAMLPNYILKKDKSKNFKPKLNKKSVNRCIKKYFDNTMAEKFAVKDKEKEEAKEINLQK